MKKKLTILISLLLVLFFFSIYFFFQNKQTLACTSTFNLISNSNKLVDHKSRSTFSLALNKYFASNFKYQNVKNNIVLVDIFEKNITIISKIRFVKADKQFVLNNINVSIGELEKFYSLKILNKDINCRYESAVYNLILPVFLLLSLIIYISIIRLKYIF